MPQLFPVGVAHIDGHVQSFGYGIARAGFSPDIAEGHSCPGFEIIGELVELVENPVQGHERVPAHLHRRCSRVARHAPDDQVIPADCLYAVHDADPDVLLFQDGSLLDVYLECSPERSCRACGRTEVTDPLQFLLYGPALLVRPAVSVFQAERATPDA